MRGIRQGMFQTEYTQMDFILKVQKQENSLKFPAIALLHNYDE